MKERFYITTPIYYASGLPHLGHVYCTVFCDVLARAKKILGHEVFFSTGLDEHGQKIKKKALENGFKPQEFVDNIALNFKNMWKKLGINYDVFIRTTEERHVKNVSDFFTKMLANDDIYLDVYSGWYCLECESFWSETQVGEQKKCPDCFRQVNQEKEESYFFKCSKYVKLLCDFYKKNNLFCLPKSRLNEMINSFIAPGLQDLSVSRYKNDWGVEIKERKGHTVYVWLDALINYLTAVGFGTDEALYKKFWSDEKTKIVHVVGNDIARFHCIYWPMFLMSRGFKLPNHILIHGLIKIKNEKMSKSKGNAIDPEKLISYFGVDEIRYFLVSEIPFGYNYDIEAERFVERINVLPRQLGNLFNRSLTMIERYCNGKIPPFKIMSDLDKKMELKMGEMVDKYINSVNNFNISEAIFCVFSFIAETNKYIEDSKPWVLFQDKKKDELEGVLSHLLHFLYVITILLAPIFVNKYKIMLEQLGISDALAKFDFIKKFGVLDNILIKRGEILFVSRDKKESISYFNSLIK